ncbi:hypothetical protein H109_07042 [Trichophyton interdigitale MR816]|uniref:Uncharacterized protein n=1 Tax=Trichophyton interdigitale (strain MR816) TaxID=1215338 RepID=A0A059IZQ9_TRIIM|nr:hypothetical protein H109_07042 [Trichophyton interdigitale MR816]
MYEPARKGWMSQQTSTAHFDDVSSSWSPYILISNPGETADTRIRALVVSQGEGIFKLETMLAAPPQNRTIVEAYQAN